MKLTIVTHDLAYHGQPKNKFPNDSKNKIRSCLSAPFRPSSSSFPPQTTHHFPLFFLPDEPAKTSEICSVFQIGYGNFRYRKIPVFFSFAKKKIRILGFLDSDGKCVNSRFFSLFKIKKFQFFFHSIYN